MSNNTEVNWDEIYKKFDKRLLTSFSNLTGNTSQVERGKVPDDIKKAMLMISYILWGLKLRTIREDSLKQLLGALSPGIVRGVAEEKARERANHQFANLMIAKAKKQSTISNTQAKASRESQPEFQYDKIEQWLKGYDRVTFEDLTSSDGGIPDYVFDLYVLGELPDSAPSPTNSRQS